MRYDSHLEPRVAGIESKLEALTDDISGLAEGVREQGKQIGQLAVAVRDAQAPRKTDWPALMAAAALLMAIGAAALSPLYLRMTDVQAVAQHNEQAFEEHARLTLHPVGAEKIADLKDRIEAERLQTAGDYTEKIAALWKEFEIIRSDGSPVTRERLSVLEEKMKRLEK